MKKSDFLSLILICVIAVPLIIFTRAICEDEDYAFDMLCNAADSFRYQELFADILSYVGVFYEHQDDTVSPQPIMAYLERHEKSPPLNSVISTTAWI
jgi:hypothetical protein